VTVEQKRAIRQVVSSHQLDGNVVRALAWADMIFPRFGGPPRRSKMGKDSPVCDFDSRSTSASRKVSALVM
jgi:hypothetical protein